MPPRPPPRPAVGGEPAAGPQRQQEQGGGGGEEDAPGGPQTEQFGVGGGALQVTRAEVAEGDAGEALRGEAHGGGGPGRVRYQFHAHHPGKIAVAAARGMFRSIPPVNEL